MDINSISQILKVAPYIVLMAGIVTVIIGIVKKHSIWKIVLSGAGTFIFTALLFYFSSIMGNQADRLSGYIKNAHPASINSITYGQAIDYCCKDVVWSYAGKKEKSPYGYTVQMDGIMKEEESNITLQFFYNQDFEVTYIKEDDPFKVEWAGKDKDAKVTSGEMEQILFKMFQKYGESKGITVDETIKDGILQGVPAGSAREDGPSESAGPTETDKPVAVKSNSIDNKDIKIYSVKNGYPFIYPNITYGQAFDEFFADPEWDYFLSEEGVDVVEFKGICTYKEVQVEANLQFILNEAEGTFQQGALSFNGVPQEDLITSVMICKAFEEYASNHNISVEDTEEESSMGSGTETQMGTAENTDPAASDPRTPEPEEEEEKEDVSEEKSPEYIFPDSSTRKLKKSEVKAIGTEERRLAKNEIYARHGRRFQDQELQEYFDSLSWYYGTIEPEDFDESVFNKIEKANIKLLAKYEKK